MVRFGNRMLPGRGFPGAYLPGPSDIRKRRLSELPMAQNVRNGQNMVVVSEAKTRKNYKCQIFWDLVVFFRM